MAGGGNSQEGFRMMRALNRSVLMAKPREPYLAWVHSLDEEGKEFSLDHLRQEGTAFLIPELEEPADEEAFLESSYDALFEYLLAGWVNDPTVWPKERDLQTFREWFDLEFSSLALDLCDWPIGHAEV